MHLLLQQLQERRTSSFVGQPATKDSFAADFATTSGF